jgi:hypothetical protein
LTLLLQCRLGRGPFGSAQGRLFDCVIVRVADDHFAQDDRRAKSRTLHPLGALQIRVLCECVGAACAASPTDLDNISRANGAGGELRGGSVIATQSSKPIHHGDTESRRRSTAAGGSVRPAWAEQRARKADSSPLARFGMTRVRRLFSAAKVFALTPGFGDHDELHAQGVEDGIDGFEAWMRAGA